jgi:hypothetical protein
MTCWTARCIVLSMKRDHVSSVRLRSDRASWGSRVSSVTHLSIAPLRVMSWMGVAPVAQFSSGPSCGQRTSGACRSEGLIAGQHVPARLRELAGDRQGRDLGAALATVTVSVALEDGSVERMSTGAVRGLDECPAQVVRPVLAQRSASVALTGLLRLSRSS